MGAPSTPDQSLSHRLEAAGASADLQTEQGIQRVRGWLLVVALVQTALYPGQFWYLAWGAMAAAERGLHGSGALGPVQAFGLDELRDGAAAAGLTEE